MGSGEEVSTLTGLLVVGLVVFVAGLIIVFARPELRGRVVGFAVLSLGAVTVVAAAGPTGAWTAALTVGATLIPLIVLAAWLAGRLETMAQASKAAAPPPGAQEEGGDPGRHAAHASLDDDPR